MALQFYQPVSIDFTRSEYVKVNAKQYDTESRYITVTCYNDGVLQRIGQDKYAVTRYKKPDGTFAFNPCVIREDGKIDIELTRNMLSVRGISYLDVMIADAAPNESHGVPTTTPAISLANGFISTMIICVNVVQTTSEGIEYTSSDEFKALEDLINRTEEIFDGVMEKVEEDADRAEEAADESERFAEESKQFSEESEKYKNLSENWAIGTPIGLRSDEAINNSKYWSEQSHAEYNKTVQAKTDALNAINTRETSVLNNINNAKTEAIGDIQTATDEGVAIIGASRDESIEDVEDARDNSIKVLNDTIAETQGKIQEIDDKADKVIGSVDEVLRIIDEAQEGVVPTFEIDLNTGHLIYTLRPDES